MLTRWEAVDNAVDRLGSGVGMERGKNQMPRLGRSHRSRDRFRIAHLADHNNVGVLPQDRPQSVVKRKGVHPDFSLGDDAPVLGKNIFNRVFDGDDMNVPLMVHFVQERRKRGGFAVTGRSHDQNKTLV